MTSSTGSTRPKRLILAPGILAALLAADAARADCAADFDGDGDVDVFDLLEFFTCDDPGCNGASVCEGDLNDDCVIDGADLGLLLAHWGRCDETLEPIDTDLNVVVREHTDSTTRELGLREFEVLLRFEDDDDTLLNVFNADLGCICREGFQHAPILGGVTPLLEAFWDALDLTFDSFVTIGLEFGDDNQVALEPIFPDDGFLNGLALGPGAGWFNASFGFVQGRAGEYPNNEVHIATFTIEVGAVIAGAIAATYIDEAGQPFVGSAEVTVSAVVGDLTGDGVVGPDDLLLLLGDWGVCADCENCSADLDADCAVGGGDLVILLGNWG